MSGPTTPVLMLMMMSGQALADGGDDALGGVGRSQVGRWPIAGLGAAGSGRARWPRPASNASLADAAISSAVTGDRVLLRIRSARPSARR